MIRICGISPFGVALTVPHLVTSIPRNYQGLTCFGVNLPASSTRIHDPTKMSRVKFDHPKNRTFLIGAGINLDNKISKKSFKTQVTR